MSDSSVENPAGPVAGLTPEPPPTRDLAANAGPPEDLVRILDEYLRDLKAGKSPDRTRLLADHPELAGQLEACLAGLEFMARGGGSAEPPRRLGAFRVVREVGRGGMGVVYEAEDVVLGRRVALKVLRFGALCGPEAVERFEREAATVARLHHTNIVPIFSVGAEQGVHYFAMQYIEGRTLADIAREGAVDARRAAGWALQAAEALDHAHRHGVIHRDVKPSNLLLDADDRIWLTDFGLARRADDATMSVAGALLGTPRYMSPEQASLVRADVDHRTDIYSLGATLYELLSGAPAFAGDSPHQVIHAILTTDPDPPRQLRAGVPRDLDTIVMKCLEKDAVRRYASARELADDLRAWLDGRAIRARQPSLAEQAVRWLRQQRRGVLLAAGSIAATLLLTLATVLAMNLHRRWQLGFLSLTTEAPRLAAEVLDERGEPITPIVGVPTQEPLEVPAGHYTLRAHSPGRLRSDMRVEVPRGQKLKFNLDLEDQTLWPTIAVGRTIVAVPGDGRHNLLSFDDEGLKQIDGSTGLTNWLRQLGERQNSLIPRSPGAAWPWDGAMVLTSPSGIGPFELHPWVLAEPVDLNRDGFHDYVLAARHQAWLLAVSGSDGQVLWSAPRGSDVIDPPSADVGSQPGAASGETSGNKVIWRAVGGSRRGVLSAVVAPPEKTPDLDADGVPDLLAVFGDLGPRGDRREARRWIEAISGASGQPIWRYEFDSAWFEIAVEDDTPDAFRWFVGASGGYSMGGGSSGGAFGIVRRSAGPARRYGEFVYVPQPPHMHNVGGEPRVLLLAGRHLILLDARTGTPAAGVVELPYRPARAAKFVRHADGKLPVVVGIEQIPDRARQTSAARVFAWSLERQALAWSREAGADFPTMPLFGVDDAVWPVITDLNDDGRPEAIFPQGHSSRQDYSVLPWGGLEVCDAATGKTLWVQRLLAMDQQIDHFLVGPDIDSDGYRDVFAASVWGARFDLYIDALSGKTGEKLWATWQKRRSTDEAPERFLSRLRWWSAGADGWPRLLAAAAPAGRLQGESILLVVSAGTGEVVDEATQFERLDVADVDGDGVPDLLRYHAKDPMQGDRGGTLDAFSGASGERWRWLGQAWQPAADFDGDRIRDLVQIDSTGAVRAMSGLTGQMLWTSKIKGAPSNQAPAHSSDDDLNGDGVPDLLIAFNGRTSVDKFKPVHAVSGKSGRVLWSADLDLHNMNRTAMLTAADLDQDGLPEVVLAALMDWGGGQRRGWSNHDGRLWLVALSGQQGTLRWKTPLMADGPVTNYRLDDLELSRALADLDGDGALDIVIPAQSDADATKLVLRAVDGQKGKIVWEHPLPPALENYRPFRGVPPPLVTDMDEDGVAEVYSLEFEGEAHSGGVSPKTAQLCALNAADGKPRWTWQVDVEPGTGRIDDSNDKWRHRPMPRLLRRSAGGSLVCVNLWGDSPVGEVVSLDVQGKVAYRTKVETTFRGFEVWTDDLTGDGTGELLFINGPALQAVDPAHGSILWQHPFKSIGGSSGTSVLGILASAPGGPTVFVQEPAPASRLYGLDGATGKRIWTCAGPKPKIGGASTSLELANVLSLSSNGQPPMLHFGYASTTAGWQGSGLSGASIPPRQEQAAKCSQPIRDPRLMRRLPWVPPEPSGDLLTAAPVGMRAGFFCLALLVLPGATLFRMLVRRRWGLWTLAFLPLVAALFVTASLIESPESDDSRWGKFMMAAAALPVVIGLAFYVGWMVRRRWRPIVLWTAVSGLIAAAAAAAALALVDAHPRLVEGQYYSPEGWYWIWLIGAYLTAILLCVVTVFAAAIRAIRRQFLQWHNKAATA